MIWFAFTLGESISISNDLQKLNTLFYVVLISPLMLTYPQCLLGPIKNNLRELKLPKYFIFHRFKKELAQVDLF
jgi:hypothetical protein